MAKNRLSRELWLAAGFQALTEQGPVALKAEPLARRLGTTKGSFYWHFQDVPAFQAAMLDLWETQVSTEITRATDAAEPPVKRLRQLGKMGLHSDPEGDSGADVETAIRAWASESSAVAAALSRVDTQRLDHLNALLAELGLTNSDLSRILYGALLGMQELTTRDQIDNSQAFGTLVDLILALYDSE